MRGSHLTAPRGEAAAGKILGWALAAVLAVAGIAAVDHLRNASGEPEAAALDPASLKAGFGARTFVEALAAAEVNLEGKRYLLAREPDDWLRMEGAARALLSRARLTGSAADLTEANRLLATGIENAPWPAGPTL